jgi:hypothetical protein
MVDDLLDLSELLYRLSDEALGLARQTAAATGDGQPVSDDDRESALALRRELVDLGSAIDAADDPTLRAVRSETFLDLNYVLSGGTAPLSLRLAQFTRDAVAED